jgi:Xaa-Pro aminopeptidase
VKALREAGRRIRIDPSSAAFAIARAAGSKSLATGVDPCIAPKATKCAEEIAGARAAHLRDGVAVARFLAWLDTEAAKGNVDEIGAVKALEVFRRSSNLLRDISFDTISGSGPNGAIVHYRVTEATNRKLQAGELFLLDSGAQYADGTTDITRTVAIGTPTDEMKARYTAVLKGHLAISMARFPKGTRGVDLDGLARRPLWALGLDYDHGTGHGVGSYLSVHEGPASISKRGMVALEPGMILSNEPGYYKTGAYGIRIENLVLVEPPSVPADGEREMLGFATLTLAPYDRRLIVTKELTQAERQWIDAYHGRVLDSLGPELDRETHAWLAKATAALK